jgi:hypothetical protein
MSALVARIAPWLLLALAVAGVVIWLLIERNATIGRDLDAARAVIEQHEQDRKANEKAVQQLAQKLQDTETKVIPQIERVYVAPRTTVCADTPAMRAASDGMRELFPGGQAADRRQPAPAVR